jgi:hypothetical protein
MSHTVVETPDYLADAKDTGISAEERSLIVTTLANDPMTGEVIPGTGGARKVRFGAPGRGKRGGYRVITFFTGVDLPVFLVAVFAKGSKINLSQAERNELRQELAKLPDDYRYGVHRYVQSG